MASTSDNLSNITTLAIVGAIGFVIYEFWQSSGAFITTAASDIQGLGDWFTGDAVYNADGTRIPLSTAAQSVLNAANIYPLGVVQTDIPGIPNVVRVYNVSTDTTWDVDPATGGVVS
jgi:hypothetical protein